MIREEDSLEREVRANVEREGIVKWKENQEEWRQEESGV